MRDTCSDLRVLREGFPLISLKRFLKGLIENVCSMLNDVVSRGDIVIEHEIA